ncbi:F0F1 ATP synthase subunit delta [Rothia sp. LK2588]|uniref:F0F1 ATP synthase subunit delta n=1 Tax=Rothia sp. LK2588 TaxID=3114369 RepID=UPI0034CD2057
MAGVSTESLKKVEEVLGGNLAVSPDHLARELFAIVDVLDQDGGLRRGLTDTARTAQARASIVKAIFSGKVSESAINVVSAAAQQRWSDERDLADALETSAVIAAVAGAESAGGAQGLEEVINDLLTFINGVDASADVQRALTDDRAQRGAKEKLALTLAGHPDNTQSQLLIERVAVAPRGFTPARLAEKFADQIVKRQQRSIARVSAAKPLSEAQIEKLRAGLSKAYGKELKLDITIDPELIGGLRVQVGDEVMDGTVQTRLHDLSRSVV